MTDDTDEIKKLRSELAKERRRAIAFADIVDRNLVVMGAAVIEGHLQSPAHGLQWIVNTLEGPGLLPSLDEARELGGAQAWFDRKMAEHDEFRRTHHVPDGNEPIQAKDEP